MSGGTPTTLNYPDTSMAVLPASMAALYGDRAAVVDGDTTLTYAELDARSAAVASALRSAGVAERDVVLIYLTNSIEFVVSYYGSLRAGATVTLVNPLQPVPGLHRQIVETGAVAGVTAENKQDGAFTIAAKNTVLATSGFAANKEMLKKYMPEIADAYPMVAPGATGEGILWGMELGAAVANMNAYQGYGFYKEGVGALDQGIANRGGILVNLNTERFCNEYDGYSQLAPHVIAQPEHHVYLIFDEANAQATGMFETYKEKGAVISADTVEALAEQTGLDAAKLARVFDDYRAGIERGEDMFNRTKLPASFEGPFHAIYMTSDLRHTQGGLVTDVKTHVLREDGTVIQGLYAAGGVMEGFSSRGGAAYMSGNGLLQALVFGKIAGECAATETRGQVEPAAYQG